MDYCQDKLCKDCDCICNNYTRNGLCIKLEDPEAKYVCQHCGQPLDGVRMKRHGNGKPWKWIESNTHFDSAVVIDFEKGTGKERIFPICKECHEFNGGF